MLEDLAHINTIFFLVWAFSQSSYKWKRGRWENRQEENSKHIEEGLCGISRDFYRADLIRVTSAPCNSSTFRTLHIMVFFQLASWNLQSHSSICSQFDRKNSTLVWRCEYNLFFSHNFPFYLTTLIGIHLMPYVILTSAVGHLSIISSIISF